MSNGDRPTDFFVYELVGPGAGEGTAVDEGGSGGGGGGGGGGEEEEEEEAVGVSEGTLHSESTGEVAGP
jgi:hypothetical protein